MGGFKISMPKIGGSVGRAFEDAKSNVTSGNLVTNLGGNSGAALGGAILGPAGAVVGANAGANLYNGAANQLLGEPPSEPKAPSIDPTFADVKAQQVKDAREFRANLGNTQRSLYEGAYKNERQNLARNLQQTAGNANARGLLYSGLAQGAALDQRRNSASNLSQARNEINNSTEDAARQMEANAIQSGIQQQQSIASIQDQTMSQALANMAARRQMINGAFQGGGAIVGTALANRGDSTNSYGPGQPTKYGT